MFRKTAATLALTVGLVGIGAGAASAHECYVANRLKTEIRVEPEVVVGATAAD